MSARPSNRPPSDLPPRAPRDEEDSARAGYARDSERDEPDARSALERILPELIRRGFEVGREKVTESKFPRELGSQLVAQLGDMRSGVVKAVAQEVGRFLREADIASEVRKILTGMNVEAQVRLRFTERKDGKLEPDVEVELGEKKSRSQEGGKAGS